MDRIKSQTCIAVDMAYIELAVKCYTAIYEVEIHN
jgi:hypothetical protein